MMSKPFNSLKRLLTDNNPDEKVSLSEGIIFFVWSLAMTWLVIRLTIHSRMDLVLHQQPPRS